MPDEKGKAGLFEILPRKKLAAAVGLLYHPPGFFLQFMKKFLAMILLFPFAGNISLAATFSDVSEGSPFFTFVESLVNLEIVKGFPDGTFKPNQIVNRIEALSMILKSAEISTDQVAAESIFTDVPANSWMGPLATVAVSRGIVKRGGQFNITADVLKAEFLKMAIVAFGLDISNHKNLQNDVASDVLATDWFAPIFSFARTLGLVSPDLQNRLLPQQKLSRGRCAEIIYKILVIKRGGNNQKLLNIAESKLVDLLVALKANEIETAIGFANDAIFYTGKVLQSIPENATAIGANKIASGFRNLCIAYQAGVEKDFDFLKQNVEWAKAFAEQALESDASFSSLKDKVFEIAGVLLEQIETES